MRTTKQILELMLANIDNLDFGLCKLLYYLYMANVITIEEYNHTLCYMNSFKPIDKLWFPKGDVESRINWLKEHIKLNTDENN